MLLLRSEDEQ